MINKKQLSYLNRDYQSQLNALKNYIRYYFPNSFKDFSPSSPGMMYLELASYVGDVLNFYLDKQINQTFLHTALQKKSIYDIAQSSGYQIKSVIPSTLELTIQYVMIPEQGQELDLTKAPIIQPGMLVRCNSPRVQFITLDYINFQQTKDYDSMFQEDTQVFILRQKCMAYAIRQKTYDYFVSSTPENFLQIELPDSNVVSIKQVKDDNDNYWYEVPFMGINKVSIKSYYPNNKRSYQIVTTNKRFIKRINYDDRTYIQFGINNDSNIDQDNYSILKNFYTYQTNALINPNILIKNSNYGEVPKNTTLSIKYYVGYHNNISAYSLQQKPINIKFYDRKEDVQLQNLIVYNQKPSYGGSSIEDLNQIKENALTTRLSNNRLVTQQDGHLIQSISEEYAKIYKSYITHNALKNHLEIYLLSQDMNGNFAYLSDQNKLNVAKYLQNFRMLGDRVIIKNPYIINLGLRFKLNVDSTKNKKQVLLSCLNRLKQLLHNSNMYIIGSINIGSLKKELYNIAGVNNVLLMEFYNLFGQYQGKNYSNIRYNISSAILNQILYSSHEVSIFQIKYPDENIIGIVQ